MSKKETTYDNEAVSVRKVKGKDDQDEYQLVRFPYNSETSETGPMEVLTTTNDRYDVMIKLEIRCEEEIMAKVY